MWLEETVYALLKEFAKYDQEHSGHFLSGLQAGKRLRLRVLLGAAMMSDPMSVVAPSEEIADAIDCYDFQHYEEVCWWIEATYSRIAEHKDQAVKERLNEEEA